MNTLTAVRVAALWYFFEMDADEWPFTMAAWDRLSLAQGLGSELAE